LGRVVGFAFLGGVMGLVGSAFRLSHIFLSLLTIFVGLTMMILGIKLTELFPRINKMSITLPSGIGKMFGVHKKESDAAAPFLLGVLTFFLPCGFTQAMQLFALSTGNMMSGALIMGFFALGTVPGLLGIGGLVSFMKGQGARLFFKIAGITVILLGIFNIQNGWYVFAHTFSSTVQQNSVAITNSTVQEIRMTESAYGYSPSEFTIKQNVPVRWIITAQDVFSCASSLVVPQLGIIKQLQKGENVIEFTPTKIGNIFFSCSMGMYRGVFHVVSNGASQQKNEVALTENAVDYQAGGGCGMMQGKSRGGCGGCGGRNNNFQPTQQIPAEVTNDTQVLRAVYTAQNDLQPNNFTVKKGIPARLEIDVEDDGSGCMSTITIQNLVQKVERLQKGNTIVFDFTPDTAGSYLITCAMGVPRGKIVVQ
jgi:sulfite exporter TauE/SafE